MNKNLCLSETNFTKNVRKEILSNGATFIHKYNTGIPVVSTLIFLKMGSITDGKLSGVANLTQTIIVKGTKNRSSEQISQQIEYLGGSISADISSDYATLSCSLSKQNFEKSLEILSDIFYNPIFPEEEIKKEKMNIIASIMSRKDSIHSVASDYLFPQMYDKHPYGRLDIGDINSIKKISRKDIVNHWEKFYGIDEKNKNIVFVVCGDIKFEEAKGMIEKYFPKIKKTNIKNIEYKEPVIKNKVITKNKKFQQGYLMYGYLSAPLNYDFLKEYMSMKILNSYLGGGMSGKLFQILREENSLCYETNSIYPTKLLTSHFIIYIGLDASRINLAKEEIEKIIYGLKTGKIFNEKDLAEVKLKIKGRFLLDHQTSLRQGWYLGFWEIIGLGYEFDARYIEEIYKISLDEVRKVINKTFSKERILVELLPK